METFSKKDLMKDPLSFYNKYKDAASSNVVIQEFSLLVKKMETFLMRPNEEVATQYGMTTLPTPLALQKEFLQQELFFAKKLEYATVLRFCSEFCEFVDLLNRTQRLNVNIPKSKKNANSANTAPALPVKDYPAFFHRKRYYYYLEWCIQRFPKVILFPTFDMVGATDLIKLRAVPVFLVGMLEKTTYADEFELTPVEFFYHDVNHSRIIVQQDEAYMETNHMTFDDLITTQYGFIQKYYAYVATLDKKLAALMKMILFEVVHEDGFPFLPDIICERLTRDEGHDRVERMENGEIKIVDKITPSTLGFVRYKLLCGFYDKEGVPEAIIVPPEMRTGKNIAKATKLILNFFECGADVTEEQLQTLSTKHSSMTPIHKCLANANNVAREEAARAEAEAQGRARGVSNASTLTAVTFGANGAQNSQLSQETLVGGRKKTRRNGKNKRHLRKRKTLKN